MQCEYKIGDIRILNVAADDCKQYVHEIMTVLEEKQKKNPETKQVLVHLGNINISHCSLYFFQGVDGGAKCIHLELHGYNSKAELQYKLNYCRC